MPVFFTVEVDTHAVCIECIVSLRGHVPLSLEEFVWTCRKHPPNRPLRTKISKALKGAKARDRIAGIEDAKSSLVVRASDL